MSSLSEQVIARPDVQEKHFEKLEEKIGIYFDRPEFLVQAFVHRSYLNENRDFPVGQNERLEFLGDAVLELVVTTFLYDEYANPEGELTNWRAALVNSKMLASVSHEIELENYLFLSHGEAKDEGTKARDYILANNMEALIGAIYLDKGYNISQQFISRWIISKLPYILEHGLYLDAKSRFQESSQEHVGITPHYKVIDEHGPDHAKIFKVGAFLDNELIATGDGTSKQEAQTEAAEAALKDKQWKGPTINIMKKDESTLV